MPLPPSTTINLFIYWISHLLHNSLKLRDVVLKNSKINELIRLVLVLKDLIVYICN